MTSQALRVLFSISLIKVILTLECEELLTITLIYTMKPYNFASFFDDYLA